MLLRKVRFPVGCLASSVLLLAGCQPPGGSSQSPVPADDPCFIASDSANPRDTATLGFIQPINPRGRLPVSESERILFRQTHESLVRFDCNGSPRPGLARRWTSSNRGLSWDFELDSVPGLGRLPLLASDIVARWEGRRNGGIWPWPRIIRVEAISDYTLRVELDTAFGQLPAAFAQPELAVEGSFKTGVTAYPTAGPLVQVMYVVPSNPPVIAPVLRFQAFRPSLDQRDMLDLPRVGLLRPADIFLTRNPDVVSYARSKPGFRALPLPWDRTYLLVAPVESTAGDFPDDPAFRQSLASQAVRGEARGSEPPYWWQSELRCPGTQPIRPMGRIRQVAYPADDPIARQLAERLVALRYPALRVAGVPADSLTASLAGGDHAAYVIPVPRVAPLTCGSLVQWPASSLTVPLVDSRSHVIVRPGSPAFSIEGDGTIRFQLEPPGGPPPRDSAP
jgi:hypothetical protein